MKNLCLDSKIKKIIIDMLIDYSLKRDLRLLKISSISVQDYPDFYSFLSSMQYKHHYKHTSKTLRPIYQKYRRGEINYFIPQIDGRILVGGIMYKNN